MKRVLILTAGFGEGHNAAARNLAAAIDELEGPGTAVVADLFAEASPRLNQLSRKAYLGMINRTPRLWNLFYAWVDRSQVFPRHLWFLRKEMAVLGRLLRELGPEAVCSTYPVYGFMTERLHAEGRLKVPFYSVVTDSISINTLWTRPANEGWFVPNPETAEVLWEHGVPGYRIHDLGFPVQRYFSREGLGLNPPDLAAGARPRVLYMIHSGLLHAEGTARALLEETDWELTLAVGRDEGLRRRLEAPCEHRRQRGIPTTLLSWTNQIPQLLLTHHAVISKAGGATTQEAIAAHCPMIVNQIVPGQEEGNYELLRRRGIGAHAEAPAAVVAALRSAFADQGRVWHGWRRALTELARPEASLDIARKVLAGARERSPGYFAQLKP